MSTNDTMHLTAVTETYMKELIRWAESISLSPKDKEELVEAITLRAGLRKKGYRREAIAAASVALVAVGVGLPFLLHSGKSGSGFLFKG